MEILKLPIEKISQRRREIRHITDKSDNGWG